MSEHFTWSGGWYICVKQGIHTEGWFACASQESAYKAEMLMLCEYFQFAPTREEALEQLKNELEAL